jgi:aspartokinase
MRLRLQPRRRSLAFDAPTPNGREPIGGFRRLRGRRMIGNVPTISPLRHNVTLIEVAEAPRDDGKKRQSVRTLIERLGAAGITLEGVAATGTTCTFMIEGRDTARFASAIRDLGFSVKCHERCARIAMTRSATDWPLPSPARLLEALEVAGIEIVRVSADGTAMTLVVDESDASAVACVLSRFYQRSPGSTARLVS